jgi:hypothetical protein
MTMMMTRDGIGRASTGIPAGITIGTRARTLVGGEHYGPHSGRHDDWDRGAHHDWYGGDSDD